MSSQTYPHETEQIVTYKPYMASLLCRLQAARALTSVQINNSAPRYNSLVINVDTTDKVFFLDELAPENVHKNIKKGTVLNVVGRLKGVYIEFVTKVLKIEDSGSIAMYRVALPDVLIYRQRRRHYRASVNTAQDIYIDIPANFLKKIHGEIIDISASGICTRLDYTDCREFEMKQEIHNATLRLPGRSYLTFDLEVRNIRHFPEQGYSLVGGKFIDILPKQQNHVDRIVAMLDRSQRRSATL